MIHIENIAKRYGANTALAPTTVEFPDGSTTVLLGPSGCGKSTLLRIILRLIRPDDGQVKIDGEQVTDQNAQTLRRRIGYVIQDGGLFPHLTARDNVVLLARYLHRAPAQIDARLGELCELAQIAPGLLTRYPAELSGGQRQRVGLMRALMLDPATLLLDEPLGALDPIIRSELQEQLKEIFLRLRKTVVLVTHDIGEAAYLADRIALMQDGRIVQIGTLTDLANRPSEAYVTQFLNAQRGAQMLKATEGISKEI